MNPWLESSECEADDKAQVPVGGVYRSVRTIAVRVGYQDHLRSLNLISFLLPARLSKMQTEACRRGFSNRPSFLSKTTDAFSRLHEVWHSSLGGFSSALPQPRLSEQSTD